MMRGSVAVVRHASLIFSIDMRKLLKTIISIYLIFAQNNVYMRKRIHY